MPTEEDLRAELFRLENTLRALEAQGGLCKACNVKLNKIIVHHVKPRRVGGNDHSENLELVCSNGCHTQREKLSVVTYPMTMVGVGFAGWLQRMTAGTINHTLLSARTGLSPQRISILKNGRATPSKKEREKLIKHFCFTPPYRASIENGKAFDDLLSKSYDLELENPGWAVGWPSIPAVATSGRRGADAKSDF